jgi:hypothetical protein
MAVLLGLGGGCRPGEFAATPGSLSVSDARTVQDSATRPGSDAAAITCPSGAAQIQQQIFVRSCAAAGCHGSMNPALGLDLVSPNLEARLLGAPSIGCRGEQMLVAGQPDLSQLYRKISDAVPECGERMPAALPALSEGEVVCLQRWILTLVAPDGGAPRADGGAGRDAGVDQTVAPGCPSGQAMCGTTCTSLATDRNNCGTCARTCGASQTCSAGICACTGGLTDCAGACVDLQSNGADCGACGHACATGTVCSGGSCVKGGCGASTTNCNGSCVDLQSSVLDCGACGHGCASGQSCSAGTCACPSGSTLCGSACTATSTDSLNCGSCGHACGAGSSCVGGSCALSCAAGTTVCSGACVSTSSDARNCGSCGHACASGESCNAGVCVGCGPPVSFSGQVQPIFNASCTSNCHSGNHPAGGLSLASSASYGELVNVASSCNGLRFVAPGSPQTSYLINKLTGSGVCSGSVMPKAGSELPQAQVDLIRGWICQGAPKN